MFSNALARHTEMLAKLIQGLAIVEMELVEESASAWIGQGFEDIVHVGQRYATKRLHINSALANPGTDCSHLPTRRVSTPWPGSVLQIKRAGPGVDDPMMGPKDLGPE